MSPYVEYTDARATSYFLQELLSLLVDHELGLEADPSAEDQELLAALSGHGLSAKFNEEDEVKESKASAANIVDAAGKLLDQLVDVICVVATRTGIKKVGVCMCVY